MWLCGYSRDACMLKKIGFHFVEGKKTLLGLGRVAYVENCCGKPSLQYLCNESRVWIYGESVDVSVLYVCNVQYIHISSISPPLTSWLLDIFCAAVEHMACCLSA